MKHPFPFYLAHLFFYKRTQGRFGLSNIRAILTNILIFCVVLLLVGTNQILHFSIYGRSGHISYIYVYIFIYMSRASKKWCESIETVLLLVDCPSRYFEHVDRFVVWQLYAIVDRSDKFLRRDNNLCQISLGYLVKL